MIKRLDLVLETNKIKLDYNIGSVFHGVLMENINRSYGDYLHNSGFNPFSQYIYKQNDSFIWRINTLDLDAYENIIEPLLKLDKLFLKQRNQEIIITEKKLTESSAADFIKKYYKEDGNKNFYRIKFVTPVTFKIQGEYQLFPDLKVIYRNIMNRFDEFSKEFKVYDEKALEHLLEKTKIVDYNLKTSRFYLEKTRIPGYIGNITIGVKGSQSMESLLGFLFAYAEYSGIGIKTSLGMGGIIVI